jgi:transposase
MRKLSQRQWSVIEPLLPRQDFRKGGRPRADDKKTIEGILWVLRTGAQWNELPEKYGKPMTCWRRLNSWQKQGVWKKIWKQALIMLDKQDQVSMEVTYLDGTFAPAKKGDAK